MGILVGGVIVVTAPRASASPNTLYVAVGGVDSGNCQTQSTPCATIPYAVSQAASGDTVDVGPGTFTASLASAMGVFLTIQGSTAGSAPVTTVEPTSPEGTVFSADRGGWTLDDLTIEGLAGDAIASGYGSTIDVVDSTITDSDVALCGCGPVGIVNVENSTITDNTYGANAVASGGVNVTASTVADNFVGLEGFGDAYSIAATILSGNAGDNCSFSSGAATDAGYNLDDLGDCGFTPTNHSQSNVDPELGTLQDNGGPTETMAPAHGSPALDQIPPGATGNSSTLCPGTDQRGAARPEAQNCDIGAVEPEFAQATCSAGTTCTAMVSTPSQSVSVSGTKLSDATATLTLSVAPQVLSCPNFAYSAPVATLTDTGLETGSGVEVIDTVPGLPSKQGIVICYQPVGPSPPAPQFLGKCHGHGPGPCYKSIKERNRSVVATLVVPAGDPRFHVGGEVPVIDGLSPAAAAPGKEVTIEGLNLSEVTAVTVDGVSAHITKAKTTKVTIKVPIGAQSGVVHVTSAAGGATSQTVLRVT
jgi:hypothetical protein